MDNEGRPYDIIVGTFLVVGLGKESFESLSEELAATYYKRFRFPEIFERTVDDHVIWHQLGSGNAPKIIL